jgi:hypothetical protein
MLPDPPLTDPDERISCIRFFTRSLGHGTAYWGTIVAEGSVERAWSGSGARANWCADLAA